MRCDRRDHRECNLRHRPALLARHHVGDGRRHVLGHEAVGVLRETGPDAGPVRPDPVRPRRPGLGPGSVTHDQAIMLSDIYPTAWFGARLAEVGRGDTVLTLGAGPVGQGTVTSSFEQGAGRVLVVDGVGSRSNRARARARKRSSSASRTPSRLSRSEIGVDRVVGSVGVDAQRPKSGPAVEAAEQMGTFGQKSSQVAPEQGSHSETWSRRMHPASQCSGPPRGWRKRARSASSACTPPQMISFPIGAAMNENLTVKMGNCSHRRYIPRLLDPMRSEPSTPRPSSSRSRTCPRSSASTRPSTAGKRLGEGCHGPLVRPGPTTPAPPWTTRRCDGCPRG
jgi:hypothetical protein